MVATGCRMDHPARLGLDMALHSICVIEFLLKGFRILTQIVPQPGETGPFLSAEGPGEFRRKFGYLSQVIFQ